MDLTKRIIDCFCLNANHEEELIKQLTPYIDGLNKLSEELGYKNGLIYHNDTDWSYVNTEIQNGLQFYFKLDASNLKNPFDNSVYYGNLITIYYVVRSPFNEWDTYQYEIAYIMSGKKHQKIIPIVNKLQFEMVDSFRFQTSNMKFTPAYKRGWILSDEKPNELKIHESISLEDFMDNIHHEIDRVDSFLKLLKNINAKIKLLSI